MVNRVIVVIFAPNSFVMTNQCTNHRYFSPNLFVTTIIAIIIVISHLKFKKLQNCHRLFCYDDFLLNVIILNRYLQFLY